MTNIREALAHTKNLAKQYRGVLELAEALEGIASYDQAKAVAEAAAKKAQELLADARRDLTATGTELSDAREAVESAEKMARKVVVDARTEADAVLGDARDEASRILAVAKHKVEGISNQVKRDVALHSKLMGELTQEETDARTQLDETRDELEKLLRRLTALHAGVT